MLFRDIMTTLERQNTFDWKKFHVLSGFETESLFCRSKVMHDIH